MAFLESLAGFPLGLVAIFLELFYLLVDAITGDRLSRLKSPHWLPKEQGNVVITGGSSGLGLATARHLARLGHRIIITGRDEAKGKAAAEKIREETGNNQIEFLAADFTSFKSVRQLADRINQKKIPIHLLVNNAGMHSVTHSLTNDGLESMFQANHASVQLFTLLLLDRIKEAKPGARIVNLSSLAHFWGHLDFEDLQLLKTRFYAKGLLQYGSSKLANILFTRELQQRLVKEGRKDILVVAVHPGFVATELARQEPGATKIIPKVARTPTQGASTQIYCSLAPAADLVPGGYYVNCRKSLTSPAASSKRLARELWEVTQKLYSAKW